MAMSARFTSVRGTILAEKRGGARRTLVPDRVGSVVALVDSSQTVTVTYNYWPYGEIRSSTGTAHTPFRFVGNRGYYQNEGDVIYVRQRSYASKNARWLSVDPIRIGNHYQYAWSSPTTYVDPSGLHPCAVPCIACAPCAVDMFLVCSDCGTDACCWNKCVTGVWNELPWYIKLACGAACVGCIACFAVLAASAAVAACRPPVRPPGPSYPAPPARPPQQPTRAPRGPCPEGPATPWLACMGGCLLGCPVEASPRYVLCFIMCQAKCAKLGGAPPGHDIRRYKPSPGDWPSLN
jgi:RHS repeat-associated protein